MSRFWEELDLEKGRESGVMLVEESDILYPLISIKLKWITE